MGLPTTTLVVVATPSTPRKPTQREDQMLHEVRIARKLFKYSIIPASEAEPIRLGAAMMHVIPGERELRAIVEPYLGGLTMIRMKALVRGEPTDMFVDALAVSKGLPRNELATIVYRTACLVKHPHWELDVLPYVAGTAVLFDQPVWFE